MPIVYVVQTPEYKNISRVSQYGETKIILQGNENLASASLKLEKALESFTSEDYLLLIGKSTYMGLATHFALQQADSINFLVWQSALQDYRVERFDIYE
jgi:hypothetical protein